MTETERITVVVDGKDVVYSTRSKRWTYDGVDETKVRSLNPTLHTKITTKLNTEVQAYQDRVKTEQEAKKKAEFDAKVKMQKSFMKSMRVLIGKNSGFKLEFVDLEKRSYSNSERYVTIKKDGVSASIEYDSRVYSTWGGTTTKKVWNTCFDYKHIRYVKLETAVSKVLEKINNKISENQRHVETQQKVADLDTTIEKKLKKFGFEFKGSDRSRSSRRMAVKTIETKGDYDAVRVTGLIYHTDEPDIRGIQIQGLFTLEQLKQIAEAVEKIGGEPAYDSF